jgi:hypothetical protein
MLAEQNLSELPCLSFSFSDTLPVAVFMSWVVEFGFMLYQVLCDHVVPKVVLCTVWIINS